LRYLPWNRLQLDSAVDGGWRALKQEVFLKPYRTYKKKLLWSPFTHKNGAVFYGEDVEQRLTFLRTLATQSKDFGSSGTIALFDFKGDLKEIGDKLETESKNFEYHPYGDTLEQLLEDLYKLRSDIREAAKAAPTSNRKVLMILIDLDADSAQKLGISFRGRELLQDLLANSENERIYIFTLSKNVEDLPGESLRSTEWAIFLGDANRKEALSAYKNFEEGYYSFGQVQIGTCYSKHEKRLISVQPLEYTRSQWLKDHEEQLRSEDEDYENFLKTLDDGVDEVDSLNIQ
jgi:hypothetical protein